MTTQTVGFSHRVTMDDVVAAYRLFLRRAPEDSGYRHYQGEVAQGMSIEQLVSKFTQSAEYQNLNRSEVIEVKFDRYSVCVDPNETDFAPGIMFNHDYEPHVRRAISERFRAGQTFVDIGANIGCISFHAAVIAGPTGQVIAIEPNPTNVQRLYAGIVLNGFTNIRVLPHAVSDRRGTFSLAGGTSNSCLFAPKGIDASTVYTSSIVPDDDLAHLPSIDFVKMDIEGYEPIAIRGFKKLLRKHSPTLLTEFAPALLIEIHELDPTAYLTELFAMYRKMFVITQWGDAEEFTDARSLMAHWHRRDKELTASGTLPEGMLHFDIVASND